MSKQRSLAVVILAAGKGTRMRSDKPKVMHEVLGLPMVKWVINTANQLDPEKIVVVVGNSMEEIVPVIHPCEMAIQEKQLGTGDAIKAAMPYLKGFEGNVLVLLGDMPLISFSTLKKLVDARNADDKTGISVLGAEVDNPFGYGRIIKDSNGKLEYIREEKDASEEEKKINIVNAGAFCLDSVKMESWLLKLDNNNNQKEYYITDLPKLAAEDGISTSIALVSDIREVKGCNTKMELVSLEETAQQMMRESFISKGVTMQDPSTVYLHHDTQMEEGTFIEPNVYFGKGVSIGKNVHIKAFCHFEGASIGDETTIGPFARLRPGTEVGKDVKIGNFVEIKKSVIGDGSKLSHLGYVGDTIMGKDVNFSCGAITVNYDGFQKYQTVIGDGVMVGSNVNLVAPIKLDDGAFIAAGSTITKDVPADSLSMERGEVQIRKGWAALYRKYKSKGK